MLSYCIKYSWCQGDPSLKLWVVCALCGESLHSSPDLSCRSSRRSPRSITFEMFSCITSMTSSTWDCTLVEKRTNDEERNDRRQCKCDKAVFQCHHNKLLYSNLIEVPHASASPAVLPNWLVFDVVSAEVCVVKIKEYLCSYKSYTAIHVDIRSISTDTQGVASPVAAGTGSANLWMYYCQDICIPHLCCSLSSVATEYAQHLSPTHTSHLSHIWYGHCCTTRSISLLGYHSQ